MRFSSCEDLKLTVPSSSITAQRCCMQMSGMLRLSVVFAPCFATRTVIFSTSPALTPLARMRSSSESSGACMGEPTDQRLMLVFMISNVVPRPSVSRCGSGARRPKTAGDVDWVEATRELRKAFVHFALFAVGRFVLRQLGILIDDLMFERFVFNLNAVNRFVRDLFGFRGDGRDDLPNVKHFLANEGIILPHALHAAHGFRRLDIHADDLGARKRRGHQFRPKHVRAIDVVRIFRGPCRFQRTIDAIDAFPDQRAFVRRWPI